MDTEVGRSIAIMPRLRRWAKTAKQQTMVMYFAARDSRTPWVVRLLALVVAAYALSPIDLIPDFIPVLGYVDDLLVVPLGLLLVVRLLPPEVLAAARDQGRPCGRPARQLGHGIDHCKYLGHCADGLWSMDMADGENRKNTCELR